MSLWFVLQRITMQFEIFNDKGNRVLITDKEKYIPLAEYIEQMAKNGYKFKIDGALVSKKKVNEIRKREND